MFVEFFLVILDIDDFSWEFTGTEEEGAKSIPYQLQRLFLQLQVLMSMLDGELLNIFICFCVIHKKCRLSIVTLKNVSLEVKLIARAIL